MLFNFLFIGVRPALRKGLFLVLLGSVVANACPTGPTLTPGTQHCSTNQTGTLGAFGWSIWSTVSGGCITPYGNTAAFNATWNLNGNMLAREGFQWNETKTYDQYGTVSADYTYTRTGAGGGFSYIGIYGWSNTPLIEFYIVDDWFGTGPPPTGGGALQGTFTADSGTYRIYTHQQVNQPSIHGTTTFMQFFSVRQTPRQCGHISVTDHFNEWKRLGMNLGLMYEAKLFVEVGGGAGTIDYSVGNMTSVPASALFPRAKNQPLLFRGGEISLGHGKSGTLSLLSLDGVEMRSMRRTDSKPATLSTGNLSKGLYLLRFQGEGNAPETRKLLLQ